VRPEEFRRRVTEARVARLATVDAKGRPHAVPFCFVLVDDTLYSAVDEKPKSTAELRRLDNIRNRPDVAVLIDHYDENWDRLWWVRLDGIGRVLDTGDERDGALAALIAKYDQYRAAPPTGAVIAVAVHSWRTWSASGT
jgi:PPOX class probable F420-dependent enzyme